MASTVSASLLPSALVASPSLLSPIHHPVSAKRGLGAVATSNPAIPGSKRPGALVPKSQSPQLLPSQKASFGRGAVLRCQASPGKEGSAGDGERKEEGSEEPKQLSGFSPLTWPMDVANMLPLPSSDSAQPFHLGGSGSSSAPRSNASSSLSPLSQSQAAGIILRAAMGTGWTTTTGLEGPSLEPGFPSPQSASGAGGMLPFEGGEEAERGKGSLSWPELTSSPRRTSRVKFTCNRCGERTIRAINPHAYGEGTVFVQCGGCLVFHKLVDNLNLFHELQGSVFMASDAGGRGFGVHESVDILGVEDSFPRLPLN